jgi:DNA-binding GntR family transcriptional regulator
LIFDQISKGERQLASPIPRTVTSTLVENLRDEILLGELVPGQHIRLEEIAARFDVSTMPVREALRDLEAEGLVNIFPHRGAVVTQLSSDDLQDIYDVRAVLEEMATRLAVPHMTEATFKQLLSYINQMDSHLGELVTLVKLNNDFHNTLYNASGRRHLCDLTCLMRYRTQHYLHAFISHLGGMPQAQAEHRAIIEACRQGDADRAAMLVHNHVVHVGDAIIEYVRQQEEANISTVSD